MRCLLLMYPQVLQVITNVFPGPIGIYGYTPTYRMVRLDQASCVLLFINVPLPESAGPTCANNCPFARTGPLRTKSRCEVPMRFTPGWHSGDAGVCLWAVHGATELRVFTVVAFSMETLAWVFTVVAFCAAWNGGGVL